MKTLDERMEAYYGPGGALYGLARPSQSDPMDSLLGRDTLRADLSDADRAVVARRRAHHIHWQINRYVDDMLERRMEWHEARKKKRKGPRNYLLSCSYCGAWRIAEHDATCRAQFGFLAYIAEGHSQSCLAWDYSLRCKRYPERDGPCE